MLIYNYDSATGLYLNSSTARENPRAAGQYLMPSNATAVEPTPGDNEVSVFSEGAWTYHENKVGMYYSTVTGEQYPNSNPLEIDEQYTKEVPPSFDVETEYLSWVEGAWSVETKEVQPKYADFWVSLIRSSYYAKVRSEAMSSLATNVVATEFIAILGDAKAGLAVTSAIQTSLDSLLSLVPADVAEQAYLTALFVDTKMGEKYSLNF